MFILSPFFVTLLLKTNFTRMKTPLLFTLLLGGLFLSLPFAGQTCDRSDLNLNSIVYYPSDGTYDIEVTLNIGGGRLGAAAGADDGTLSFGFGIFGCADTIEVTNFPPSLMADTTGNIVVGVASPGPVFINGVLAQGALVYQNVQADFICTSATALCGRPHTQTFTINMTTSSRPDSIRVYSVEGMGNPAAGCLDQDMVLTFPPFAQSIQISGDTLLCDGAFTVLSTNIVGNTYQWSTGVTSPTLSVTAPGTYSVTITDSSQCTYIDSLTVTTANSPTADFNFLPTPGNQTFDFIDLSSGDIDTYLWDFGDGTLSNVASPTHTYATPGTYFVCLTTFGICGSDSFCQTNLVVGTEPSFSASVGLHPNPTSSAFYVTLPADWPGEATLSVWDVQGRLVWTGVGDTAAAVSVAGWPAGVYGVMVQVGRERAWIRVVVE